MKVYEILTEDGRIVKGVNTTVDVGPDEIKKQAAKFGNTVDRDGRPPTLSKKVKGKSTNVLFNLGLTEGIMLKFQRGEDFDTLHIKPKGKNRVELRGKPGYERGNYDAQDKLHQVLDNLGKAANFAELMNGETVTINPKHPDGERAKKTAQDILSTENFADDKKTNEEGIPYQDIIAKAINDKKMTYIDPNTGEERSVMNPKHVGNRQKELEFKYTFDYPMTKQERLELRPWVNIPGNKSLMRLPVTKMTMQQAVDWDMLGHPDMPQATIDAARKRYPNDERVKNPTTYKLKSEDIEENFADGKKKGKSRPGRVKKAGASCKGSVTSLRKKAAKYSGEKGKMYHWCANMKGGKK